VPPSEHPVAARTSGSEAFVVLGDTQRTTWMEELIGREQNDAGRRALIEMIAEQETPAFVVHLGDMVESGGSATSWRYFDRLVAPLTSRGIPILPLFGNHDLWGSEAGARRNARARFPQLGSGGYAMRFHELGLIWLDSNVTGDAASRQTAWFGEALKALDDAGEVRGILVFTHHPAYTNGKHRHPEPYVTSDVLPRFLAAKKTMAMMSAHVHGYERFVEHGRTFVVTGGGGGPRVEYAVGSRAPFPPAYVTVTGEKRPLNYVTVERTTTGLVFTARCTPVDGRCEDGILERFSVAFPSS
jgi:hypothetical protein